MTDKIVLATLDSIQAETSALNTLNANFSLIEAFCNTVLSLNGLAPNQMGAVLDMNSHEIINLPTPVKPSDVVRLADLTTMGTPGPAGPPGPTGSGTGDMLKANNLSELTNFATARANLELEPGTDVEAWSATLDLLAALSTTSFGRSLLTAANATAANTLLTLGGAALLNVGTVINTVAAGNDSRFWNLPFNLQNSNYTLALTDRGKVVNCTSGSPTWTIPPSIWTVGDTVNFRVGVGAGTVSLIRGSGVSCYLAGGTSNSARTLAAGALGTAIMEAADTWVVSGAGIT